MAYAMLLMHAEAPRYYARQRSVPAQARKRRGARYDAAKSSARYARRCYGAFSFAERLAAVADAITASSAMIRDIAAV